MIKSPIPLPPTALAAALALSMGFQVFPVFSRDAEPETMAVRTYAIPTGPLTAALNRFAQQAGLVLSFDPALAQGSVSPGLAGSYDIDAGFAALLSGSGLRAVRTGEGTYSLQAEQTATVLAPVRVHGQADAGSQVSTEGQGYAAAAVSAGAKTAQSLREIPRSVSVIARQQLDDQRITTLDEAMEQMPGVTLVPGSTGYMASAYYTRGFQITSVMVDGSPAAAWSDNDTSANTGMSKYDNVQLLRGPDGIFSGNGQPSGSVNLVRKRPLDFFQLKYTASAGSWSNYFGEMDVTGRLVDSGRVRGRFVAAYNDRAFFFDGADRQISTLFGTLAADLADTTVLTVGISQDEDRGSGRDIPPGFPRHADGSPVPVPRDQGYADWSWKDTEALNAFATLDHTLSDAWAVRVNVFRADSKSSTGVSSYNGATDPRTGQGSYLFQGTWADSDFGTTAIDVHLSGDFRWLDRRHRVVLGADHRRSESDTRLLYNRGSAGRADIVDWRNTDPSALLPSSALVEYPRPSWLNAGRTTQRGAYGYADVQLLERINLVLGGRYSGVEMYNDGGDASGSEPPPSRKTHNSHGHFTPYYALKYTVSEHWTAYFATAESFEDQSTYYTQDGDTLDPVRGRSYELGIKGDYWDGRLNGNLTVYRSRRDNFAVRVSQPTDFDLPGRSCCYVGDGEFLAQGVEVEVSGQILHNWQINGGYTYDDNETEYGANDGLRYASYTPRHIFRVWTRYGLPGRLSQLALGGGVKAQSDFFRSGTVNSWDPAGGPEGTGGFTGPAVPFDFVEPGRALWNFFAEYQLPKRMTLALNVNNAFDRHYFRSVESTSTGNRYGEPRAVLLTLRGSFD